MPAEPRGTADRDGQSEAQIVFAAVAKNHEDKFLDSLVVRDLTTDQADFSDDEVDFARRNPQILNRLLDPLEVKKRYIYVLFSVALGMAVVAKLVEYTKILAGNEVWNDLMTNVLFAFATELFGAAVVAFVMELVFERRVQRNKMLVETLLSRAEDSRSEPTSGTADPEQ